MIGKNKFSQSTSKTELHGRKIMLWMQWDWQGIIYLEFSKCNETLNSPLYAWQCVHKSFVEKHSTLVSRKYVVLHDNTRPQYSRNNAGKTFWNLVGLFDPNLPYSLDPLVLNDYYLFTHYKTVWWGKIFSNEN